MRTKKLMFLLLIFSLVGALSGQTAEQLPIPVNFKFAGDTLIWDGVENAIGYSVNIINATAQWIVFDVTENTFIIPENHPKELVYFRVKANGDNIHYTDSIWSDIIKFKTSAEQLPTPVNFKITFDYFGDTLSWSAVDNAVGYTVNVIMEPLDVWLVYDVTENSFNIPKHYSYKEGVEFKVKANGDNINYFDSKWSDLISWSYEKSVLDTPTNLEIVGKTLTWDKVKNAAGYTLSVGTNLTMVINIDVPENRFSIPDIYAGATFVVVARGDNIYYLDSDWSDTIVYKLQLPTPKNLKLIDNILTWDYVETMSGIRVVDYTVNIITHLTMMITFDVTENSFNIPDQYVGAVFEVKANGDGIDYSDSEWSEKIGLLQLDTPTNLKIQGMVLTWDHVETISSGRVSIYTVDVRTPAAILIHIVVTENSFNIPEQYAGAIFAVKAMGDNIYYTDSEWSEPVQDEDRLNESDVVISNKSGLLGNYPNPFNPTTSISFALTNNSFVGLDVYNMKGQKVRSLANGNFTAGQHSVVWNGQDDNGSTVSSGVYFYRITTNEYTETKKMIMIK